MAAKIVSEAGFGFVCVQYYGGASLTGLQSAPTQLRQ